jgi:hypothetical protein
VAPAAYRSVSDLMEASMAAQAQGDGGAQADGGEAQGFEQAAGLHAVPDLSALADRLDEMAQGQDELRAFLTQNQFGPGDHAWPEDDGGGDDRDFDLDALGLEQAGLDPGDDFALDGDPAADAQELADHFAAMVDHQTAPLRNEIADLRQAHEASELIAEFPEMGDGETAEQVLTMTAQFAQVLGQPELAGNLQLARVVYLAGRAVEMAQQEGEEPERAAHLEGGGGAGPAGGRGVSAAQSIVEGGRRSVLPFG